jgi:hypothetical protein
MLHNIPSFNEAFILSNIRQLGGIKKTGSRIGKVFTNVFLEGKRKKMTSNKICLQKKIQYSTVYNV